MPQSDIGSAEVSDFTNRITDYSVDSQDTDGVHDQAETTWQMTEWSQWLGYYKEIPELQVAIDTKANWTVGAGFEADEITSMLLSNIKGLGKDSFNSILGNMIRTYTIGGDSFAEIIRDKEGILINLKPLDPSSMVIVVGRNGRIKRYEQVSKTKQPRKKFKTEEILHFSRKRVADEIHGISVIPAVEWIIKARNEAMADWKTVLHRLVWPLWIIHADTDDTSEIAALATKWENAYKNKEFMIVPKGVVEPELVSVSQNSTLNPVTWINQLNDYFFQAVNVPQIVIGNSKEFTDASGKIVYLAYEQSIKEEQLYIEEQILDQLNIEIKLTFPATLENDTVSERPDMTLEEEPQEKAAQPNDTTAELEGKK